MLKKIWRLFLGLIVCASSACVTPTHASSATPRTVIITKIQAASPTSAKDELIELYNTTANDIDLSGWCLTNKASIKFACFDERQKDDTVLHAVLPSGAYATVVSHDFLAHNTSMAIGDAALSFAPTNQSSGSLVASADTVTLVDAHDEAWDTWSWQTAVSSGKLLSRQVLSIEPLVYATEGVASEWQQAVQGSVVRSSLQWLEVTTIPSVDDGYSDPPSDPSHNQPKDTTPLQITELLPNPAGLDTGNEFIELYNPNLISVSGEDYKLLVGANLDKTYSLPAHFIVEPLSYAVIKNDVIKFSLSNTAGAVQLLQKGVRVDKPVAYANPPEGESWAIVAGMWRYTNSPTPGTDNSSSEINEAAVDAESLAAIVQKPCATNQYRNLATGRCKLIAVTASTQAPCKVNQTRSLDTGRCRNNVVATVPVACKVGQARSPETNRCRTITKMSKAPNSLKVVEKSQKTTGATWYMWLGIGGIILAILSYAMWEWREEMQRLFQKIKRNITKRPR